MTKSAFSGERVSARMKGELYKTAERPVMIYGLDTEPMGKRQEVELEVAELKILRLYLLVTRMGRIINEYIRETATFRCFGDKVSD